ncbi:MAG: UPF0262 family protein [Proteobacteria bacterium]|nr:UPF0262 family protein [Pseudomonadota bacterium]
MSERICKITLDENSMKKKRSAEAEHERDVAITDLLDENVFEPKCMKNGPYKVHLSIADGKLVMDVQSHDDVDKAKVVLSIAPLRGVIRDYFMICESYYDALKGGGAGKIEAIDMGRRGVHNEGSEAVQNLLKDRILIDFCTARRLFTLICVLHIK